ncbi:MAG: DMT family transporter [Gammaproteobacteria bacterium]|nr:DMT family transporter [Gammaproteobacteria bacterium]
MVHAIVARRALSTLPVAALLLGATLWGVLWYPLRWFEESGLTGLWVSLIMNAAALGSCLPLLIRQRREIARAPVVQLLLLMLAAGFCNTAFILAVIDGTVVRVLLLFYLAPVWASLLGWWLLRESLSVTAWITLVMAMSGALIMLWDTSLGWPWPQQSADWLALASGVAFAVSNVLVRKMADVPVTVKTMAAWVGGVVLAIAWIGYAGTPVPAVEPVMFALAAALGILGITLMTLAVQYGVSHMPVHRSAVILLFEVVVGAVSAAWLAHEILTAQEWAGGLLIVVAAWLSAHGARQEG